MTGEGQDNQESYASAKCPQVVGSPTHEMSLTEKQNPVTDIQLRKCPRGVRLTAITPPTMSRLSPLFLQLMAPTVALIGP